MVKGPVSGRRYSRRVVRQAVVAGFVVLVVLLIGYVGWNFYQGRIQSGREARLQQQDDLVRSYAAEITAAIAGIQSRLAEYSRSEKVRSLFESEDSGRLADEAVSLAEQFQALKARLLLPGRYALDTGSFPPLSYASLDVLGRAEKTTGPVAAEVHMSGTENEHIVLVERVKNQSDQLIGIIHLSLDVALLKTILSGIGPVDGYIEIRQSASGQPLILAGIGDLAYKVEAPVTSSIAGTRWALAYWGEQGLIAGAPDAEESDSGLVLPGLLVLVIVGIIGLVLKKKKFIPEVSARKKPDVVYAGAIRAIMDGAHPGMEKLIANLPGKRPAKAPARSISRGMSGDDITLMVKQEDLQAGKAEEVTPVSTISAKPPGKPEASSSTTSPPASEEEGNHKKIVSEIIFRKYDIRGVVGDTLTPEIVVEIGRAIGTEAGKIGQKAVIVGRDGRLSSPELAESLIKGLRMTGRDVIDIGVVPTPLLYFATHHLDARSGVMLTGSHNGPEYNGLKIVLDRNALSEGSLRKLYQRIVNSDYATGSGALDSAEIIPEYIRRVSSDIPVALGNSYKLVIDCGNGVGGVVAPQLFNALGHDVIELFCELDGRFPNHHPDPSQPGNLQALISKVREVQADLGFAFDGDADRLGVVDGAGNIIWPDRQLMAFARDVLSRNQGAEIIYDVKCSSHLRKIIEDSGGKALMWKTGHSLIKTKMKEINAPLAGEMSGHIFFKERWYGFDDGLYAGARLLEILMASKLPPTEFFAGLSGGIATPELRIDLPETEHQAFMRDLEAKITFDDATIITVDGFRAEFSDGWGLIRPSNTTPCLIVRFEADDQQALERIETRFRELLLSINPDIRIPF